MKVAFSFIFLSLLISLSSFMTYHEEGSQSFYVIAGPTPDTTFIANRMIASGGKIMTDQDALMVLVEQGANLISVEIYYSSINTLNSDSSRIFVKTQRSWSCAPLGNANPFQIDQYTLGLSNNVAVQVGWNRYSFEAPIEMISDTIYIWPDLIQQIHPRVVYGVGNHPDLYNLTGTGCANQGSDISTLDYTCELEFVATLDCIPYLHVMDSDSMCYAADTILATTTIDAFDSVTYLSSDQVILDTTFAIEQSGQFLIDMTGCKD